MTKKYLPLFASLMFTMCIFSSSLANGLLYSAFLGGNNYAESYGIAVDSSGNAYVAGYTYSLNFPVTSTGFQTTNKNPSGTVFVSKINTNSSGEASLVYSTYLGGSGVYNSDKPYGIAVDSQGFAYIAGYTGSTDFPITSNALQTTFPNNKDTGFISKINTNSTGTAALVYSSFLGGNNVDEVQGIAVDPDGNAYLTGYTESTNFPITANAFQTTNRNSSSGTAFVSKINTNFSGTTSLVYSSYLGGSGSDGEKGFGIAVDSVGNAYLTGVSYSTNFPVTSNAFQTTNMIVSGLGTAFLSKINTNSSGTASLVYSTFLGGSNGDGGPGFGIAADSFGNAYVTGYTGSPDFPITSNAYQTTDNDINYTVFLSKINTLSLGTASLVYSTFLGGSGYYGGDEGNGIAIDSAGNAYLTGFTGSTDFPITPYAFQSTPKNIYSLGGFISKINTNSSGTASLVYSSYLGGSGNYNQGNGIAVDSAGNAYLTGYTNSTDFPVTPNAFQTMDPNTTNYYAVFLTKLSTLPPVAINDWESYANPSEKTWNNKDMDARKPQE